MGICAPRKEHISIMLRFMRCFTRFHKIRGCGAMKTLRFILSLRIRAGYSMEAYDAAGLLMFACQPAVYAAIIPNDASGKAIAWVRIPLFGVIRPIDFYRFDGVTSPPRLPYSRIMLRPAAAA